MGMMRRNRRSLSHREVLLLAIATACLLVFASPNAARAETTSFDIATTGTDDTAARAERWKALQKTLFGDRKVQDGSALIKLDAPPRAMDAALVPVGIELSGTQPVKSVWLVIDNNPGPLAGHFKFGPQADPRTIKTRVRVNEYTFIHAVAETADGTLYSTEKFVKAAGGCSAPAGADDAEALQAMGNMKLKLLGSYAAGKPLQAQLMIRHPNYNGMQMNQITRYFTPARFIKYTEVSYNGASVFSLESDISMSSDPVITFGFVPKDKGQLKVVVRDSKNTTFDKTFDVPSPG